MKKGELMKLLLDGLPCRDIEAIIQEQENKLLKIIEVYEELDNSLSILPKNLEAITQKHTECTYLRLKLELLKKEAGL